MSGIDETGVAEDPPIIRARADIQCSFCGKTRREVQYLMAGPSVYICDECVGLCNKLAALRADGDTFDYGVLSPGIRRTVRLLREAGFNTTDSGDGETETPWESRPCGHVVVVVEPEQLVDEALRLVGFLIRKGLTPVAQGAGTPPVGHCVVEASFNPVECVAIIDVSHVHDRMLRP